VQGQSEGQNQHPGKDVMAHACMNATGNRNALPCKIVPPACVRLYSLRARIEKCSPSATISIRAELTTCDPPVLFCLHVLYFLDPPSPEPGVCLSSNVHLQSFSQDIISRYDYWILPAESQGSSALPTNLGLFFLIPGLVSRSFIGAFVISVLQMSRLGRSRCI